MAYSEYIKSAIDFLLKMQNDDGGIKIGNSYSEVSGIWTTAECLDAVISSDYLNLDLSILDEVIKMMDYLKGKFIICPENPDMGFWEIADTRGASTMTTGHSVRALQISLNRIFSNCDIQKIVLRSKEIEISTFISEVRDCINKATNWLQFQQQSDGGWNCTGLKVQENSSVLATYYVLRGLNSVGKKYGGSPTVDNACRYIMRAVEAILNSSQYSRDALAEILYAYPCLQASGYFKQSDTKLKNRIMRFIHRHWGEIKLSMNVDRVIHKNINFVNNLPYITLNALLTVEDYTYESKMRNLIQIYLKQQKPDGSWSVIKEETEETTWVTAEAILALSQAQSTYRIYYEKIVASKKVRLLKTFSIVSGLICSIFLLYYFFASEIFTGSNVNGGDYWKSIPSFVFGVIGAVTSIFSVIDMLKKK